MSKFKFTQEERDRINREGLKYADGAFGFDIGSREKEDALCSGVDWAIEFIESILSERYVSDEEIEKNAIDKFPPDKWSKSHRAFCIGSAKWMRSRIFKNQENEK